MLDYTSLLMESIEFEQTWGNIMLECAVNEREILLNEAADVEEKAEAAADNATEGKKSAVAAIKKMFQSVIDWMKGTFEPFVNRVKDMGKKISDSKAAKALRDALSHVSEVTRNLKICKEAVALAQRVNEMSAVVAAKNKLSAAKQAMFDAFDKMKAAVRQAKEFVTSSKSERKEKAYYEKKADAQGKLKEKEYQAKKADAQNKLK